VDYCNRIQKEMLRFSRWHFFLSEPQYFMTAFGQSKYWLGPKDSCPPGQVNTGLNLTDVDYLDSKSVCDISNDQQLGQQGGQPLGPSLNKRSGQTRPGQPKVFWQDHNDPFTLNIFPGANNDNTFAPYPDPSILSSVPGGALAQRTYFVRLTLVDTLGGESIGSSESTSLVINANNLISVTSPYLQFNKTANGVTYAFYNVYATSGQEGTETLQNVSPIAIGINWQEPTTGLTTTGVIVPGNSTLAQMLGFIITFRYYKARTTLTNVDQVVLIPDDYIDVMVNGISALGWKLLQRADDASACQQLFKAGMTQMVWDKNLSNNSFIRPDPASFSNQQILGELPNTNKF
jgi:hypothetical protein